MSPKLRHIILPRNNIPHYDDLPDISAYAIGIIDPGMDGTPGLQQVLLLLRQCTPLRRRTKRAQREVLWREESTFGMQTLLRCMQGTRLGLYPNCLKTIAFLAWMQLLRFLQSVLVQPFAKMHACMHRIPYIIKLCVMEQHHLRLPSRSKLISFEFSIAASKTETNRDNTNLETDNPDIFNHPGHAEKMEMD
jgi:hypothetical protein